MTPLEEAESLIESIVSMAESEDLPGNASDFAESVRTKAESIGETIDETENVTERQLDALRNMRNGLSRWFRD